ncbi:hypothetical protein [Oceanobacillus polygoni]|uniref:Uncharacterized protein n=1 Tax=Oceanobacillus polygoni TaxID=1235259 RepID=A0A9X1CDC2_9BACI|nr:hypothetical protein [Oceanobacillus polygoni]MBP2078896.1 hypothetical protein [Oceanobacillus polygoni]
MVLKLNQNEAFESFIKDSFKNGTYLRELRLSESEVEYVKTTFPNASISVISKTETNLSVKKWYEVNLKNAHVKSPVKLPVNQT